MTVPTDAPRDHAGLMVLSYDECLKLAASEPIGRIAFADGGEIHVLPVNHCLVGGLVAFRSAGGSKLGAALEGSVVAFEVDRYDPEQDTGWSVLVQGRAEIVTQASLLARLRTSNVRPWRNRVSGPEWVAVRPDMITGRRL